MSLKTLAHLRRRRTPTVFPGRGETPTRLHPHRRRWWIAALVAVAVLLVIRFIGSPIATSMVNRQLADLPGVVGRVDGVHLALWRGAVDVENFVLYSRGHEGDLPLLHVRKTSLRLGPGVLFRGRLGGSVEIDRAMLNVVKRERIEDPTEAAEEAGREMQERKEEVARWQDTLRETFPLELTRFEVKNSQLRFVDRSHEPNVDVAVEQLHIVATDLQNRPKADGDALPARVQIEGVMTGGGRIRSTIRLDPIAEQPRFTANFELRELQLPEINPFLRAYADADVSRGSFEFFAEVEAEGGGYNGYVKPMFHELDFRTASDEDKNVAEKLKEKVVSAVTSLLENEDEEQVATRAPFSGNFADNDVDIWTTMVALFRNAFVQALRGGLEGQTPRQ